METRTDQDRLMEYLYDELPLEEREDFEKRLAEDAELRKQLDMLQNTRSNIAMADEEVVDPFLFSAGGSNSVWLATRVIANGILKPMIGLAAGVSIMILLGYFTKLNVSTEGGYLNIAFGKTEQPSEEFITKAQLDEVLGQIEQSQQVTLTKMRDLSTDVETQFASLEKPAPTSNPEHATQLSALARQLQKDNLQFLERYLSQAANSQERMVENMLVDFSDYLQGQREEDLRNIQYSLEALKTNQEMTTMETNQVLATIINKVNTQNN